MLLLYSQIIGLSGKSCTHFICRMATYPVDKVIHSLNNRVLVVVLEHCSAFTTHFRLSVLSIHVRFNVISILWNLYSLNLRTHLIVLITNRKMSPVFKLYNFDCNKILVGHFLSCSKKNAKTKDFFVLIEISKFQNWHLMKHYECCAAKVAGTFRVILISLRKFLKSMKHNIRFYIWR